MIKKKIKQINKVFKKIKYFGFKVAIFDILSFINNKIKILPDCIREKKHKLILKWLKDKYSDFFSNYKNTKNIIYNNSIPKNIWICWWDGIEDMPQIVKTCYNSVLYYAEDYKITVITKYNYQEYVTLPNHIIEKVNKNIITITHLSDILRMGLIYNHGGLWLDASILITNKINLNDYNQFFTIKRDYGGNNISKQRWTGNCIAGSPNLVLFGLMYDFFCEYWIKYNFLVDYHLIDYALAFAYENNINIKNIIDSVKRNNCNYMILQKYLNKEYNINIFNELCNDTIFHRLTWKKKYKNEHENRLTFFGYIMQNIKNNG